MRDVPCAPDPTLGLEIVTESRGTSFGFRDWLQYVGCQTCGARDAKRLRAVRAGCVGVVVHYWVGPRTTLSSPQRIAAQVAHARQEIRRTRK
jgi:hypothetical protein